MEEQFMPCTMLGEKSYTPKHLAHNLNKNIETIRRWIRSGKLKSHMCGNSYYIVDSDLQKFLRGE